MGQKQRDKTDIEIHEFAKDSFECIKTNNVEDAFKFKTTDQITWININGLNLTEEIAKLGIFTGCIRWCWKIFWIPNTAPK